MNLEQYPQFVEAVREKFHHHVEDGKVYIAADDINALINFISNILIQEAQEGDGMCVHAHEVASFIISNITAVTDTIIGIHAGELVKDLDPSDFKIEESDD